MNRIKKGDNIMVIAGKDLGKRGKVLKMDLDKGRAIVEGINNIKRRQKPKRQGEKGSTITLPSPIRLSNIQPFCTKCKRGVRVNTEGTGKDKVRVCAKCKGKL